MRAEPTMAGRDEARARGAIATITASRSAAEAPNYADFAPPKATTSASPDLKRKAPVSGGFAYGPGRSRTFDRRIMSPLLYR